MKYDYVLRHLLYNKHAYNKIRSYNDMIICNNRCIYNIKQL